MSKQIKADLSLLAVTTVWGYSFVLMRNVLEHMPSFAYLSLRFIIATLVLVLLYHKKLRLINGRVLLYGPFS
jgi:drug/metabolite transporter (DMT)-like permease